MPLNTLLPTANQTFEVEYDPESEGEGIDFADAIERAYRCEEQGDYRQACTIRYDAFRQLVDLIPDNETVELEWNERESCAALTVGYLSAIDHFLVGDFEMSAAQLEMLLELDPEDHLEASTLLAYDYCAMQEWESFDEVIFDLNDKSVDKIVLIMWSEWLRNGSVPEGELMRFRTHFAPYYAEFIADSHPVNKAYLRDVANEHPTRGALAREFWLQKEHLWALYPQFIEALKPSEPR